MNYIDRFANDLKFEKLAIYLYGAGFVADRVVKLLKDRGVEIDGYIVDQKFLPKDKELCYKNGKPIISADELDKDCVLIDAIQLKNFPITLPKNEHIKRIHRYDFSSSVIHGAYDEDFVISNIQNFIELYNKLSDAESRVSLTNFISQKLTGLYSKTMSEHPQYFDEDIFLPQENESFVDCGAYDGDSLQGFFAFLKKHNVSSYRKCFAFEPDEENYNKLVNNMSKYSNVFTFKLGTYVKKDVLHFSDGRETGSSIQSCGDATIEVDSLDNILAGEDVTYIKMDIEGAELDSLKGARETILRCRPKLAICVYHKMDDLLTIPNYLLGMHKDYKLYLRNYNMAGVETILYAI